jgi:hypothetical protein
MQKQEWFVTKHRGRGELRELIAQIFDKTKNSVDYPLFASYKYSLISNFVASVLASPLVTCKGSLLCFY